MKSEEYCFIAAVAVFLLLWLCWQPFEGAKNRDDWGGGDLFFPSTCCCYWCDIGFLSLPRPTHTHTLREKAEEKHGQGGKAFRKFRSMLLVNFCNLWWKHFHSGLKSANSIPYVVSYVIAVLDAVGRCSGYSNGELCGSNIKFCWKLSSRTHPVCIMMSANLPLQGEASCNCNTYSSEYILTGVTNIRIAGKIYILRLLIHFTINY